MGQDQGQGVTRGSTPTFPIPSPPSRPASSAPYQQIPPSRQAPGAPRQRGPSHAHHHWRSWGTPQQRPSPGQRRKNRRAKYAAIKAAAKESEGKLAKLIITATNMHGAAIMTSARVVAQALDRLTDAIKARETTP